MGPLLATLGVLVLGTLYYARSRTRPRDSEPSLGQSSFTNPLRIVSWNLRQSKPDGKDAPVPVVTPSEAAVLLAGLSVHAIALQNVPTGDYVDQLARKLGTGWKAIATRRGTQLADFIGLLIHPEAQVVERTLIQSGTPVDALGVSIAGPQGRLIRLVCVQGSDLRGEDRARFAQELLSWARRDAWSATLVAGLLDERQVRRGSTEPGLADPAFDEQRLRSRFAEQFAKVDPWSFHRGPEAADGAGAFFVTRPGVQVVNTAVIGGSSALPPTAEPILLELEIN
jgi:hypothetical protein